MRKNYFLILLFIAFSSCQKDESLNNNDISPYFEEGILDDFNPEDFENIVNTPFKVDLSSKNLGFSQILQQDVISLNLILLYKKVGDKKYQITYNLLAIATKKGSYKYFIAKYYSSNFQTFSMTDENTFSGYVNIFNKNKKLVYANKYYKGKKELKDFFNDDFEILNPKKYVQEDGCHNIIIYNYTDWYKVYPDGTREYTSSVLNSISTEFTCSSSYYPESGGSGTGGGTYSSSGSVSGYEDCEDPIHGCVYEVIDRYEPADCNTFENKVSEVINTEGDFVNDPNDPGGPTNKGISWSAWTENAQSVLGVDPTLDNLKDLSSDQAKLIYKEMYWDKIDADNIKDGDLRYLMFDFYVNAGGNAIKVLQKTLNDSGYSLDVDGVMGTNTLNAINNYPDQINLYNNFRTNRQDYYNNITLKSVKRYLENHPNATDYELTQNTLKKYINGWTNRVNSFIEKTLDNNINVNC